MELWCVDEELIISLDCLSHDQINYRQTTNKYHHHQGAIANGDPYLNIIVRSNMRGREASSSIALVPVICIVSMSALRSGVMG